MGLATHLGIILQTPSIGCTQKVLCGRFEEPPQIPGCSTYLRDSEGETIGLVLRTNYKGKLLFVSPGNMIDFKNTLSIVLACLKDSLLPYPLELAHRLAEKSGAPRTRPL